MTARISVIVPIFNVAPYLTACLTSLSRQSHTEIQVVLVDDGSSDGSAEVAASFADADPRFVLIQQANRGPGAARNVGLDRSDGDFIGFVDGDDIIPFDAYAVLAASLEATGSDLAGGAVQRFGPGGTRRARIYGSSYSRTDQATHITRRNDLLLDRIVTNKLWRRSFWEQHGLRFPEGVLYEDIEVALGGHVLARQVDLLTTTVYWWRERHGLVQSTTQRRAVPRGVTDRIRAVRNVTQVMTGHGLQELQREYDTITLASELMLFVDAADAGDDEYRRTLVQEIGGYLAGLDVAVLQRQRAIDRLKYHFIGREMIPELLETLSFERMHLRDSATVGSGEERYGDYVFRGDRRLRVPDEVYRLTSELQLRSRVDTIRWTEGRLHLSGFAYIDRVASPDPESVEIRVIVTDTSTGKEVVVAASTQRDAEATRHAYSASHCYDGAGFTVELTPEDVIGASPRTLVEVDVEVEADGVRRRGRLSSSPGAGPLRQRWRRLEDGRYVTVSAAGGTMQLHVHDVSAFVNRLALQDGQVVVRGVVTSDQRPRAMVARHRGGVEMRRLPLATARPAKDIPGAHRFRATFALADFVAADETPAEIHELEELEDAARWDFWMRLHDGDRIPLAVRPDVDSVAQILDGRDVTIRRSGTGTMLLVERLARPVVRRAAWSDNATLILEGDAVWPADAIEVVLRRRGSGEHHVVAAHQTHTGFVASAALGRLPTAGDAPLRSGVWDVLVAATDERAVGAVPIAFRPLPETDLPRPTQHEGRRYEVVESDGDSLVVNVATLRVPTRWRDARQRQQLAPQARRGRREPIVVFDSWGGTRYAGDPRAIFEALPDDADLEVVWVGEDGQVRPQGASVVRRDSKRHAEALARARWIVTDHLLPEWWQRATRQRVLQTWHGVPLKRVGVDLPEDLAIAAPYWLRELRRQARDWHALVTSGPAASKRLRDALGYRGKTLALGAPRNDVHHRPDERDARAAKARRWLGIGPQQHVVLWAPTARDAGWTGRRRRRVGLHLDIGARDDSRLRDSVFLFHGHPALTEAGVALGSGWRDATAVADVADLLTIADVLVTDYSSVAVDFLHTGRALVFFTPDHDEVRRRPGLAVDWGDTPPGPVTTTSADTLEAVTRAAPSGAPLAPGYTAARDRWCGRTDGQAAARVVRYILG